MGRNGLLVLLVMAVIALSGCEEGAQYNPEPCRDLPAMSQFNSVVHPFYSDWLLTQDIFWNLDHGFYQPEYEAEIGRLHGNIATAIQMNQTEGRNACLDYFLDQWQLALTWMEHAVNYASWGDLENAASSLDHARQALRRGEDVLNKVLIR